MTKEADPHTISSGKKDKQLFVLFAFFFCLLLCDLLMPWVRGMRDAAVFVLRDSGEAPGWIVERREFSSTAKADHGGKGSGNGLINATDKPVPGQVAILFNQQLDINHADEISLIMLPGIGDKLAVRIVENRNRHGRFASVEDLVRVPGIGTKTVERLRPLLRCE